MLPCLLHENNDYIKNKFKNNLERTKPKFSILNYILLLSSLSCQPMMACLSMFFIYLFNQYCAINFVRKKCTLARRYVHLRMGLKN